ncbi:MAG TPA: hypothetical protein VIV11_38725, partial [Kofleriaceae bacterium]
MRRLVGDVFIALLVVAAVLVWRFGLYGGIVGGIALVACVVGFAFALPWLPVRLESWQHGPTQNPPIDVADDRRMLDAANRAFDTWSPVAKYNRYVIRRWKVRRRYVARLTTKLAGRGYVWHSIPYAGPERPAGVRLDTSALDRDMPAHELRRLSRYVAACRSCGGRGESGCAVCGGSRRIECSTCAGEGKPDGLVNCATCHGLGKVACTAEGCKQGALGCKSCQGTGRLEEWATLETSTRDADVQVEPDGDFTRQFRWGQDGVDVPQAEIEEDARVVSTLTMDHAIDYTDLPETLPNEWGQRETWKRLRPKL